MSKTRLLVTEAENLYKLCEDIQDGAYGKPDGEERLSAAGLRSLLAQWIPVHRSKEDK